MMVDQGPSDGSEWSRAGLRFFCTRCSCCCRFDSGYVWLSRTDLLRLASGLGLPPRTVVDKYCTVANVTGFTRLSLSEQDNLDCVFWKDGACSVYEHRPLQCRTFPFWTPYLGSRDDWMQLESACPGVNVGPIHSRDEIDALVDLRRREPPLDADTYSEADQHES